MGRRGGGVKAQRTFLTGKRSTQPWTKGKGSPCRNQAGSGTGRATRGCRQPIKLVKLINLRDGKDDCVIWQIYLKTARAKQLGSCTRYILLMKEEAASDQAPAEEEAMEGGRLGCVVVAVDGSEESMHALRWGLDNLRLRPAKEQEGSEPGQFVVLHVQSPPNIAAGLNPGAIPFGGPDMDVPAFSAAIESHQRRISEAIIAHALSICSQKNVLVKTQVVVGDPKDMICEVTSNLQADVLVMGCRAYGAIKRMFLGSVSNYCINNVKCPVIVVKGSS